MLCWNATTASAQVQGLALDVVATHDGSDPDGPPGGYTTYRLFAVTQNPNDFVSTVGGDALSGLSLSTTGEFWQSPIGAEFGHSTLNIAQNQWDSWLTIDSEPGLNSNVDVANVGMAAQIQAFSEGEGFALNSEVGGAWYITYPCNSQPCNGDTPGVAGDDLRILLGQFTTDGEVSISLNLLTFPSGIQANAIYQTALLVESSTTPSGCSDPAACNYTPSTSGMISNCEYTSCIETSPVSWELITVHQNGTLEGMATVRIFGESSWPIFTVGGDIDNPFELSSSGGVFNSQAISGFFAAGVSETALNLDSLAEFDTWATIGVGPGEDCGITVAESPFQAWTPFFSNNGAQNLIMNDLVGGAWFQTGNCLTNGSESTLLMQCTFSENLAGSFSYATINQGVVVWHSGQLELVIGCTNPVAFNFDQNANIDNGSCLMGEGGCLDDLACNFDGSVDYDNGTCQYPNQGHTCDGQCLVDSDGDGVCDEFEILGCTIVSADNFDPIATEDDGNCVVQGCTYTMASNYSDLANKDDGSCVYSGCTTAVAVNYHPHASIDDGSCLILGCTEPAAQNFNPQANLEGPCEYCDGDINLDGSVQLADLLDLLTAYGNVCQ
ncbi:MAG: hypothetical protein O2791_00955 [Bacteroidetes bacterium]|nr:hypothetical protein [Bacteroidota bacterium]